MLREMLKHEKYYEFSKIWLEDFVHPDGRTTSMTNTNKLIRTFNGCDGGKTGFTNEAGFCLAATAKRGDTRIVSVVIGADSSKNRFDSVSALFDYAFGNFENKIVQEAGIIAERANVCGSKKREIAVCAENALSVFCKKGKEGNLTVDIELSDNLKAPVAQGDAIGKAVLYSDGIEICQTRLLAGESAERFTWWEAYREGARNWN